MNGLRTHNALLRAAQRRSDADGYPLRAGAELGAALSMLAVAAIFVIVLIEMLVAR